MNSFYQDVQLKDIEIAHKELIAFYGHSMRSINNLKVIKMAHTKFQAHSYFSGHQYSDSLQQLLNSTQSLFKFREILFFSLRQLFLQMEQILTVLQWMSPAIDQNTKRSADQDILKMISQSQKQGTLGPLPQKIYIIETERFLRVVQFDQQEITYKILHDLAMSMDCLVKLNREYIFYDRFFYCLNQCFKQQDKDTVTNKGEFDRKTKLETNNGQQPIGLRKIGVVNEYQEQFQDLDGEFYDSIANLLYSKGEEDYMNYVFMGFAMTQGDPIKINVTYGNAITKCKLYLRPNLISFQQKIIEFRPQSPKCVSNHRSNQSHKDDKLLKQAQSILTRQSIQAIPKFISQSQKQEKKCLMTILEGEDFYFQCDALRDISIELSGNIKIEPIQEIKSLVELLPYKQQNFLKLNQGSTIYGVAKPQVQIEMNSDNSSEEQEDFDVDDKALVIDLTQQLYDSNKIKEKGWKGSSKGAKSVKKQIEQIKDDEGIEFIHLQQDFNPDLKRLVNHLEIPYTSRQIDFQFAEYEVELSAGNNEVVDPQDQLIELDLTQFGFANTILLEVYSNEYVRAIRIGFPESKIVLPLINFPFIESQDLYDLHKWHIGPIDNIKGLQIQKKKIKGLEFIRNFVFLVQDSEKSRLNQYSFEYKQNQSLYENDSNKIMPQVSSAWRMGQLKIYLSFSLMQVASQEQLVTVVVLLKKLNLIYQQIFPGLIIEENVKNIRVNCVFEVFLQSMGRPSLRDNYDRYYLSTVQTWSRFIDNFDTIVTGLIDNLTIMIWSYGGIQKLDQKEGELNKRQWKSQTAVPENFKTSKIQHINNP